MIPIGPESSSSEDRSTVIKITSLTYPLTHPSLTTPPSSDHLSATSRHVIFSLTHDSHDTSRLSHDFYDIHDHLIILLCNGIRPFGDSVSVKGSTESAILWEAFRHGRPIPHRQDTLEGFGITHYSVPPQRLIWWCTIFIILPWRRSLYCSSLSNFHTQHHRSIVSLIHSFPRPTIVPSDLSAFTHSLLFFLFWNMFPLRVDFEANSSGPLLVYILVYTGGKGRCTW